MKMLKKAPFLLVVITCLPVTISAEPSEIQGTIQGLMSFCENKMCTPGEEMIIAAMEETYVLVTDEDDFYLLPNLKKSVLARHLGKTVKVEGEPRLDGKAIMVNTAEVKANGEWRTFYSPETRERLHMLEKSYLPAFP